MLLSDSKGFQPWSRLRSGSKQAEGGGDNFPIFTSRSKALLGQLIIMRCSGPLAVNETVIQPQECYCYDVRQTAATYIKSVISNACSKLQTVQFVEYFATCIGNFVAERLPGNTCSLMVLRSL